MPKFLSRLRVEVAALTKRFKIKSSRAFVIWFGRLMFDLSSEEALEATAMEGPNDKSIDLFYVDTEHKKIVIVQGKSHGQGGYVPKKFELDSLTGSLAWLENPQALRDDGKFDLAANADEYVRLTKDGYSVELWFVYVGPKCANIEKGIIVYNQSTDALEGGRRAIHCHIDLLERYMDESEGKTKRLESERIRIVDNMHFDYWAEFGRAMVATVPGNELARVYHKYEDSLFDRNVRLFLGAKKGSINAGIAGTLKSASKSNFWAFNNGLTFLCADYRLVDNCVDVDEFCIVNGCQSTRSLADNEGHLDESVTVLVRFLAVANDLVDDVIKYNNSQNPIRAWDMASQNRTQRRLKEDFDKLKKPYIYVTRRGDQPHGTMARYKNGGRPRQIKLAEVGQYLAALAGHPVLAYKNKALIFSSRHDDVFPHDIKVEQVLFAWIAGEIVKEEVSSRLKDAPEKEKRIIIKGGSLFAMAVLGRVINLRNGPTCLTLMKEEQITSNHGRDRLRRYARYSLDTYLNCVKDVQENRNEELNTLIRSHDFFDTVMDRIERQFRRDEMGGDVWLKSALPKLS